MFPSPRAKGAQAARQPKLSDVGPAAVNPAKGMRWMEVDPVIWHYGLTAERMASVTDTPELELLESAVERFDEPGLGDAWGAGRLLVPLRNLGLRVVDTDLATLSDRRRIYHQHAATAITPLLVPAALHRRASNPINRATGLQMILHDWAEP